LAPLLVDGLARAAADQQVGFKIRQTGAPAYSERAGAGLGSTEPPLQLAPKEITSGFLYAYGQSLYLTITQFRYRPERADTINMVNRRLPDKTGLAHRKILLTPEAAIDSLAPISTTGLAILSLGPLLIRSFFDFSGQQHGLSDLSHGFPKIHTLPLDQLESFLFRQFL
jgi:hypothetical protein